MQKSALLTSVISGLLVSTISSQTYAEKITAKESSVKSTSNVVHNAQGVEITILDAPILVAEAETTSEPTKVAPKAPEVDTVKPNGATANKNVPTTATGSDPNKAIVLDKIQIKGKRIQIIRPMPGVAIERGTSTTNIQSATGKQLAESKAINVTEFMNGEIQSVSTTDYSGNPFQQDLNFRGFTASPAIGTPQGVSVYMDGVRVNEAFGDVVNWDLIPMNALASLDLVPGSNPMFGLNTLGGALALRTKTGFTDPHLRAQLLGGSWGREQLQLSNGFNVGNFGFFTAYNHFKEDGWRDNSPSNLRQLYNAATLKFSSGEVNLNALNVRTKLTGNGMLPFENAEVDRKAVFTSPDESGNKLDHYNLNGRLDLTDNLSFSALTYKRNVHQSAIGADINEDYQDTINKLSGDVGAIYVDYNGDGIEDVSTLNGQFNLSDLKQKSSGRALQMSLDLEEHQITAGLTYDKNNIKFQQSQALGVIDANHNVSLSNDPLFTYDKRLPTADPFFDYVGSGTGTEFSFPGIIRNNLKGTSATTSVFLSDTWSPIETLHISYGARFNHTNVKNTLQSDRANPLGSYLYKFFLPQNNRCRKNDLDANARWICTEGDYNYRSFNPSFGVAWEAKPELTVYSNVSRGARTPTVIELGCAKDHDPKQNNSTNYQYGCSIPTALSADPYLKQVRSTAYEAGLRGTNSGFDWNIGVFRTELKDDILFMPLGQKNRGVFDNFGETMRQGIEMGMKGDIGKDSLGLNYTYLRATYESDAQFINPSNSTNTAPTTIQSFVNIEKGDSLAGMPRHIVQANWNHRFNDRLDATLSMVMHSWSYVRGNENNDHKARKATNALSSDGTNRDPNDYIGGGTVPGYAVFNLKANYKFDYGISLFAKIDNIFDRDYATAGDLGRNAFNTDGSFISDQSQWNKTTFIGPGAPRAAWIGLNFDLDWKTLNQQPKK